MKITSISSQMKNPNRVNISVDGTYLFSLDIFQVVDLGIKVGNEYSESELAHLRTESEFGKLYSRALEYVLMRPHSRREIKDYLWRKTRDTKYKDRAGNIKDRAGVSVSVTKRVLEQLELKGHVNDESFARFWVEYRNRTKGSSMKKLSAELMAKGVERSIIEMVIGETDRTDHDELMKIVAKKRRRYDSDEKFMQYLARQGFSYDAIKSVLNAPTE